MKYLFLILCLAMQFFTANCFSQEEKAVLEAAQLQLNSLRLGDLKPIGIIDLSETDSRSVQILRNQWKIPLPKDPDIIVVALKDPTKKEDYLRLKDTLVFPYGERVKETGKTYYGRFVLIDPDLAPDNLLTGREYERVMDHELVHAYVMSLLGPEKDRLPRWFHEGLATYLSRMGPRTASMEYRGYAKAFEWIERIKGAEKLQEFVRQALAEGRLTPRVLSVIEVESEEQLGRAASSWQDTRRLMLILPIFLALALLLMLPSMLMRNPRRVLAGGIALWRCGVRDRHARYVFYSLDREALFPWIRNLRTLESLNSKTEILPDMTLMQIRKLTRRKITDPEIREVLPSIISSLDFFRAQPRAVRACLWWMSLKKLSRLLLLLEKWRSAGYTERRWKINAKRIAVGLVIFSALVCWLLPRYTGTVIFPAVHWMNNFTDRLF